MLTKKSQFFYINALRIQDEYVKMVM